MFKLDENLLRELGLGALPAVEKNRMLSHIYETLEMRVGMKLAEQMTNEQLDEFEAFIDRNDEAGALKWLESNFPNYKQVVADQLEALKAEVKAAAPQILAASQQAAMQAPTYPQGAPAQQPPQAAPPAPQQQMPAQPSYAQPAPASQQYAQPVQPQYPSPPPIPTAPVQLDDSAQQSTQTPQNQNQPPSLAA